MNRVWACVACHRAYEVGGSEEEISGLLGNDTESPRCITPLCQGRLTRVTGKWANMRDYSFEEITLRSFFRAIMGFGKFEGSPAAAETVKKVLLTKKIVEAGVDPVGNPERTILHQLVFEDGTRLHFGSSSYGACCFYIEAVGPSCVEVFDREQSSVANCEAASEGVVENREEVG